MTSAPVMRKCLATLKRNQWYELDKIMNHIENNLDLDEEDWSPLKERGSYPKWKHTLQGILSYESNPRKNDPLNKAIKVKHRRDAEGKPYYLFTYNF